MGCQCGVEAEAACLVALAGEVVVDRDWTGCIVEVGGEQGDGPGQEQSGADSDQKEEQERSPELSKEECVDIDEHRDGI